jgi:hypothetical protein
MTIWKPRFPEFGKEKRMLAVKRSPFSGEICSREIPVTEDREFIMTGITPEEWAKVFPPEEEIDNQP